MTVENNYPRVIFMDIGGVFLTNGWDHEARKKAYAIFGLDESTTEALHHFIFNIYEIGKISLDEYLNTVVFHKERPFSRAEFKNFMFGQSKEKPEMLQWFRTWNRRHDFRIYSVNNEGKELNDYRINTFDLRDCFDGFISSCEVGMRKPDPDIFRLARGIAQVPMDHCFYFDDRPMHVEAARKLGIRSFVHTDFDSTRKILKDL